MGNENLTKAFTSSDFYTLDSFWFRTSGCAIGFFHVKSKLIIGKCMKVENAIL